MPTLLIAVTIGCVWLGREWQIVQERKAVRDLVRSRAALNQFGKNVTIVLVKPPWRPSPPASPNWIRQRLGDVKSPLTSGSNLTAQELARVRKAFPEAKIEDVVRR